MICEAVHDLATADLLISFPIFVALAYDIPPTLTS